MKKICSILLLSLLSASALAKSTKSSSQLALSTKGPYLFFQFGGYYSPGYGNIMQSYDTLDIAPNTGKVGIGDDLTTHFGAGYNVNKIFGIEFAYSDNEIDASRHTLTSHPQITGHYNFDITRFESALVIHNRFGQLNSEIHAKLGLSYALGTQTLSYHNSINPKIIKDFPALALPSWTNGKNSIEATYKTSGLCPVFGVGVGWSANQYLGFTLDYLRIFEPIKGDNEYGDPLRSTIQASNSWMIGIAYHFHPSTFH